jgi:methyl-accepting chemotaxis protein
MKKLNLRSKLITSFLLAGLIPLIAVGYYSYNQSTKALQKKAVDKLVAVRNIKGEAIKRYFDNIRSQIITFSETVSTVDAMRDFNLAFESFLDENQFTEKNIQKYKISLVRYYQDKFGRKYQNETGNNVNTLDFLSQLSNLELALQYYYISANPKPFGSKEEFDFALDNSTYSKLHAKYHPSIRNFLNEFGYYDIFLIDIKSGHIVYSVFKELDFATSLVKGPYKDTNIADAFQKAKEINNPNGFILVDYKKYTPSYEAPASFIATPIWDKGKKIGIAMFQMPIDKLNTIMGERSGMGKTGETYLVGPDFFMRSDSYNDKENFSVVNSFRSQNTSLSESQSVIEALNGKSADLIGKNYLGDEVISAYAPIDVLGLKWALVADFATSEAFESAVKIRNTLFVIIGVTFLVIVLFAFFLSSSISNKIKDISKKLLTNAKEVGDSSEDISSISSKLSEASIRTSSSLQETVSSIDEISSMVQTNADAAGNSTQVSSRSKEAANLGKQKVVSMIASINEISASNEEIATEMKNNSRDISGIVKVISEIGEKTKVINDIVFQTKLLSFNASVEAARAGEHGKGFAVVAEEVGNLAAMSGKAAHEITEMLDSSIEKVTDIVEATKEKVEKTDCDESRKNSKR